MKRFKNFKIICILLGIVFVLATIRYITLNSKYPEPVEYITKFGDEMEIDGYSFKIKEFEWYDGSIVEDILPGYELLIDIDGNSYPYEKEKIALATIEVCKKSEDDTIFDLTNIAFEMGAWHNQWDIELFEALNGKESLILKLSNGDTKKIVLPIVMFDFQFSKNNWENIETRKINIVFSCYPEKYVLQSSEKQNDLR